MGIFGHFAKAIVRQNGEKWPILGANLKVSKTYEKQVRIRS